MMEEEERMYWEERRRYEEEVEYFEWYRRYGRDPRGLPPPPPRPFGPGVPPLMVSYFGMSQVFYARNKCLYHFKSSAEFVVPSFCDAKKCEVLVYCMNAVIAEALITDTLL
jgi:hypothetical protein